MVNCLYVAPVVYLALLSPQDTHLQEQTDAFILVKRHRP